MGFKNRTKEKFEWNLEGDLYGLIEDDLGYQTKLSTEFPGLLPENEILSPVEAMEAEIIGNNAIAVVAASNRGIIYTPGVCDENGYPTTIFTPPNNPTPDDN